MLRVGLGTSLGIVCQFSFELEEFLMSDCFPGCYLLDASSFVLISLFGHHWGKEWVLGDYQ